MIEILPLMAYLPTNLLQMGCLALRVRSQHTQILLRRILQDPRALLLEVVGIHTMAVEVGFQIQISQG